MIVRDAESNKKNALFKTLVRHCFFMMMALSLLLIFRSDVPCSNVEEYSVKAVFTLNFARYAKWPEETFASETSACILGVVGNKDMEPSFNSIAGKKVGSRQLEVRFIKTPEEAKPCHLLFVSRTVDAPDVAKFIASVKGKPVLTIGETQAFFRQGGMINFLTKNGRLVFGINLDIVRQQNVTLSSRLLKLAIVVGK